MERRIFTTVCFVAGVVSWKLALTHLLLLLTGLVVLVVWQEKLRTPLAVLLAVIAFLVGGGRALQDIVLVGPNLPHHRMKAAGTILEPPRMWGSSSVFFFQVDKVEGKVLNSPVKVLVWWSGCEQTLEVGDRWELTGLYQEGESALYPGGFDQREWLWSQRATGVLKLYRSSGYHFLSPPLGTSPYQFSYRARSWMMRRLNRIEDSRARALVAGVVFGETQSLPKDLQEKFRRTGTSHLLAASGMNVALLSGLILGAAKLLGYGPWRAAPLAIPAVIGYAFLAGCGPSITRAATGATFALLALSWGRTSNAWNTLALSVWLLLLWDPRQVYDLGFQLSAVAVVGLVGGPEPPRAMPWLTGSLTLTFSASLITLPFFWWAFGELSSTLLLSNLLLGPAVEALFPLGLLLAIFPVPPLVWLNESIARLCLFMVEELSALGDPVLLARPGLWGAIALFAAILFWLKGPSWKVRAAAVPLVAAAILSSLYAGGLPRCPRGELVVRRAGADRAVFWISTSSQEVLVLSEAWQERRGRVMLRQMGCLVEPEVRVLEGERMDFTWGSFRWKSVEPLLPGGSYLEVRANHRGYQVRAPRSQTFTIFSCASRMFASQSKSP